MLQTWSTQTKTPPSTHRGPIARDACLAEPSQVLVAPVLMVLACCRSLLDSTGPGLPHVAKHMFQVFRRYIVSVSYGCCKSRLGHCICCNGFVRMLQAFVHNVSSVFQACCKCAYLDIAYVVSVLSGYCVCVTMVSSVFQCFFKCFRHIFQVFQQF
jgi:hypothetical protein